MEEIKFKSLTDLYQRIFPALTTKKREIFESEKVKVSELEIWNYLKNNVWINSKDLSLHDMVNDILFLDKIELLKSINHKINGES